MFACVEKPKRYFEFLSWFNIRTKCFSNGISCAIKTLFVCQLFLEIFHRISQNNICKKIVPKKNPAVLFTPAGNSAHDLHAPI